MQRDTKTITRENVRYIKKVYVSPLLDDLFRYLGQSSVLFELYMDDIWNDNSSRSDIPKIYRGYNHEKFMTCIKYMVVLIKAEKELRNCVQNYGTISIYYDAFGTNALSEYLLLGLEKSYSTYFRGDDLGKAYEKTVIKNRIEQCKRILRESIK